MKRRLIFGIIGRFMILEALLFILPAVVSLIYGEYSSVQAFVVSAVISAAVGTILQLQAPDNNEFYAKEGFVTIGLLWVVLSLVGALPFYISGEIPHYVDAFFETVSGFTTTGATILTDIERMSKGMLFWRSFTHWIGGMGVLVFAMAFVNVSANNSIHLMRAEVPGPVVSKLVPRGMQNAKILYGIYFGLCVIQFIFLICGGMPVYDSIIHTMSTAGTGGFGCKNNSIAAYNSPYIEWVITVFMFLFSINFNIYFYLIMRKFKAVSKDSEWKVFTLIVVGATFLMTVSISGMYGSFANDLRVAAFNVVSIISTTGFGTVDFNYWSGFAKILIIALMVLGACAGSTGGGIKTSRVMIMVKTGIRTMRSIVRPNAINSIKIDGRTVEEDAVKKVSGFIIMYVCIFGLSVLLVGADNLNFDEIISAVVTCFNNVGPGFGKLGPAGNFHGLSNFTKIVLCFDMLCGRLEIFPMLILFIPSMWRRKFI